MLLPTSRPPAVCMRAGGRASAVPAQLERGTLPALGTEAGTAAFLRGALHRLARMPSQQPSPPARQAARQPGRQAGSQQQVATWSMDLHRCPQPRRGAASDAYDCFTAARYAIGCTVLEAAELGAAELCLAAAGAAWRRWWL